MIIDFLNTKRSKEDLIAALEVVREFRGCESTEEYFFTDFLVWQKLEQLEEFLEHLVEGTPLADDTVDHMNRMQNKFKQGEVKE